MFNTIQAALAGAEQVFEIMDYPKESADPPDAVVITRPQGEVVFDKVS